MDIETRSFSWIQSSIILSRQPGASIHTMSLAARSSTNIALHETFVPPVFNKCLPNGSCSIPSERKSYYVGRYYNVSDRPAINGQMGNFVIKKSHRDHLRHRFSMSLVTNGLRQIFEPLTQVGRLRHATTVTV